MKDNVKCPMAPTDEVPFPNRQFNYQRARTRPGDHYNSYCWGNVALANLQKGDTFLVDRNERLTITSLSAKSLKYADSTGQTHTLRDGTEKWEAFARRLGDRLAFECTTQNNLFKTDKDRELTAIFMRDVAATQDAQGVYMLTH